MRGYQSPSAKILLKFRTVCFPLTNLMFQCSLVFSIIHVFIFLVVVVVVVLISLIVFVERVSININKHYLELIHNYIRYVASNALEIGRRHLRELHIR